MVLRRGPSEASARDIAVPPSSSCRGMRGVACPRGPRKLSSRTRATPRPKLLLTGSSAGEGRAMDVRLPVRATADARRSGPKLISSASGSDLGAGSMTDGRETPLVTRAVGNGHASVVARQTSLCVSMPVRRLGTAHDRRGNSPCCGSLAASIRWLLRAVLPGRACANSTLALARRRVRGLGAAVTPLTQRRSSTLEAVVGAVETCKETSSTITPGISLVVSLRGVSCQFSRGEQRARGGANTFESVSSCTWRHT